MEKEMDNPYIPGLKRGSHAVYNRIYDIYADKLYHFVFLHTKSREMSRDIVQETFIKLWEMRGTLREEGSLQSLLFTISKHKIVDSFRMRMNNMELEDSVLYKESDRVAENEAEHFLYYDEFVQVLAVCKRILPKRQLELLQLNKEQELSISEISQKLGISEQTVKNQLTTALKTLRKEVCRYNWLFVLLLISIFRP